MKQIMKDKAGFTLVELLVVVIILGVLAAVVIPQLGSSTDDARVSALNANLSTVRGALEVYYQQHLSKYPATIVSKQHTGATCAVGAAYVAGSSVQFANQLLLYTDMNGNTCPAKAGAFTYGPYVKKALPKNPQNQLATVKVDSTIVQLMTATTALGIVDATTGWVFIAKTGEFFANDATYKDY